MHSKSEQHGVRSISVVGLRKFRSYAACPVALAALAVAITHASMAQAGAYSWQVASGDWSVASNWGGTMPSGTNDDAYVANGGTASVSLGGISNNLYLGSTGTGTIQMSAGSLSVAQYEFVGYRGIGRFLLTGGTNLGIVEGSELDIAEFAGSSGTYSLSGNSLMAFRTEYVGFYGDGAFIQSGGTNANRSGLTIEVGHYPGSQGTYILSGNSMLSPSAPFLVGNYGAGIVTQSDGTLSAISGVDLGWFQGSSGTYNLSGAGQINSYQETVAYSGSATFNQSGGINTIVGLNVSELGGVGMFNLSGGVLKLQQLTIGSQGSFNFSGGTFQCLGASFSTTAPIAVLGNATFDSLGSATFAGSLSGNGGLTKIDGGTLSLAAVNTYSGTTTIAAGILRLANSAALGGGGAISFGGGALQYTPATASTCQVGLSIAQAPLPSTPTGST